MFLIITVFISTHGRTRNQTSMRLVRDIFRFPCIFDAIKRVTRFFRGSGVGRPKPRRYVHIRTVYAYNPIRTAGSGTVRMYRREICGAGECARFETKRLTDTDSVSQLPTSYRDWSVKVSLRCRTQGLNHPSVFLCARYSAFRESP